MEVLQNICIIAAIALLICVVVKAAIEGERRRRFRKENRERQFSGSAIREKKGFWASLFSGLFKSKAESLGESGERTVSSYLEDLPHKDYLVFNDLLIRNGDYVVNDE